MHIGYVYNHEHDFVLAHEPIENEKQILTCSTCNLLYCEKCGKELSIPHNGLEAKVKNSDIYEPQNTIQLQTD